MEMEKEVKILNLDDILPNRFQPRIKFNESAILELAESIKEHGVIQPIVVRKISDKYEIIAGERRYKASILAGKTTIPAIITTLDDKNSAEIALIENVQRQDLTPIEEAISYKKILDMGYLNQSELADKLGKTQSTIANKLRLLNLSEDVQEALLEQKISERHARSLLKLNEEQQEMMLNKIITERLTVRKTDEEIKKILTSASEDNSNNQKVIEPSLEVLDIDLEGKEEQKMNERLNIPTEEIIEPVEEVVSEKNQWGIPTQQEFSTPIVEESKVINDVPTTSTVAPGFMDVERIENEAQDIFKPQEDPADLNMLLQGGLKQEEKIESPMAPITPEVTPSNMETPVQSQAGKFFNMFNFTEAPTQPEDLEEKQVNMDFGQPKVNDTFMFNFNPLTESKQVVVEEPQINIEPENSNSISSFDAFTNQPTINQSLPIIEEPKIEENPSNLDIPNFTQNMNNTFIPNLEVKEELIEKPIEDSINNQNLSFESQNSNSLNPSNEIQVQEPEFEPFNPYALNDNNEFTQNNELDKYRISSEISENIVQEPSTSTYAVADMRTVINTIRECVKTIENYGFNIDLDELDFDDRYEVKFIIVKK